MTPEYALDEHLEEAAQMPLIAPTPKVGECGTCARIGAIKFNLITAKWECKESFPCEVIGFEREIVAEKTEQVQEPVLMEMY